MLLKQRLFSNMILRNMISDFGGRSRNDKAPGTFTHYFQYKIGSYRQDHYLYFQKEPYGIRYKNEFFNKLNEYTGSDISDYVNFHYSQYQDKRGFLIFIKNEIFDRLNLKLSAAIKQKLQYIQYWVQEKEQELSVMQNSQLKQEIELGMRGIVKDSELTNPAQADKLIEDVSPKLTELIEKICEGYTTGNIRVTEQKHLHSIIQLFYILQYLQKSSRNGKSNQRLFTSFSAIDISAVLRLHFADYREKQQNTIQKEIATVTKEFDLNSERFKRLDKALQDFFFDQNT
jgi:hypothetical protein